MRGLIYKDFSIFYKSIDKKMIAMSILFCALILYKGGSYGGLIASILIAMTVGAQNIMSFASDDQANWKKYQMTMPLSSLSVVAGKYISVICTLGVSLGISMMLNLISSLCFGVSDASVWGLVIFISIFLPLLWTGICLPLTYWFGMQSAQAMGIFVVIPIFYLVKYFEDGTGFLAMTDSLAAYLGAAAAFTLVVFGASMMVSVAGYRRLK